MTPETKAFFEQLDEIVLKQDDTAREIMAVLTALRHKDDGEYSLKQVSTVQIRRAALPKTAAAVDGIEKPLIQNGEPVMIDFRYEEDPTSPNYGKQIPGSGKPYMTKSHLSVRVGKQHGFEMRLHDEGDRGRVDVRQLNLGNQSESRKAKADRHFAGHAREAALVLGLTFLS